MEQDVSSVSTDMEIMPKILRAMQIIPKSRNRVELKSGLHSTNCFSFYFFKGLLIYLRERESTRRQSGMQREREK